uniref:Uncharacterized protein n=1 Tax=Anguilla anguilla TaxID=7936 RepID=A0A0E9UNY8_ANGAN
MGRNFKRNPATRHISICIYEKGRSEIKSPFGNKSFGKMSL